jgi:CDP-diglyceride synthetase
MAIVELKLLLLLFVANGAPILAQNFLKEKANYPLDGNVTFIDGRPLLGKTKTLRGVISSLALTALVAPLLGFPVQLGLMLGIFAMLGDLVSSFVKRRLGMANSSMALGIDQIPESLFPMLAADWILDLGWTSVVFVVVTFMITGLLASRVLYMLKIRRHPY